MNIEIAFYGIRTAIIFIKQIKMYPEGSSPFLSEILDSYSNYITVNVYPSKMNNGSNP